MDVVSLQPMGGNNKWDTIGNLRVLHTKLGSGYGLGGSW